MNTDFKNELQRQQQQPNQNHRQKHRHQQIVEANPKSVEDYKAGKNKVMGFLVGQIMKQSKGQANPTLINKLLTEKLSRM